MTLDPTIIESLNQGQILFNQRKFFEAHEVWEETWSGTEGNERHLLQGLIQVAAGFYKLQVGMPTGTCKLLQKGATHLQTVPADFYGVDLPSLLEQVEHWTQTSRTMIDQFSTQYDPEKLPLLTLNHH